MKSKNWVASERGKSKPEAEHVVVRVAAVQKRFEDSRGHHDALRSVNLDIVQGEFLTILGPSGCGKTTLLRILSGFEKPTKGDIYLDGKNITDVPPNRRPMSMVFQNYALFPHLTAYENIAYGLSVAKVPKAEIRDRVDVVLSIMDLAGLGKRYPSELSGGQQQRVALARSLVVRPRVLLLDEPISNLDARLRDQMRSELRRIQRQLGITSIYVTHDQGEAMSMSDRVVVMSDGRIEQVGTPQAVYREPTSLFVADFIGKANIWKSPIFARDRTSVTVKVFGVRVVVGGPGILDTQATVVVRPEDFIVSRCDAPNDRKPRLVGGAIEAAGWLRSVEYFGPTSHLSIEMVDGSLLSVVQSHVAAMGPDTLPRSGDGVAVRVPIDALRCVLADTETGFDM